MRTSAEVRELLDGTKVKTSDNTGEKTRENVVVVVRLGGIEITQEKVTHVQGR